MNILSYLPVMLAIALGVAGVIVGKAFIKANNAFFDRLDRIEEKLEVKQ